MKMILTASALALMCFNANAADIFVAEEIAVIATPETFSWTGVYIGATAGYSWSQGKDPKNSHFLWGSEIEPYDEVNHSKGNSFTGGAQIGYNYQLNNFVIGIEADINFLKSTNRFHGDATNVYDENPTREPFDLDLDTSSKLSWFGTVRPRVGYLASDRTMLYATAGFAYARVKSNAGYDMYYPNNFNHDDQYYEYTSPTRKSMHYGWTVGAGAEHAFTDKLTLKAEYLYVDLGKKTYSDFNPEYTAEHYTWTSKPKFSTIRLGVNYKF